MAPKSTRRGVLMVASSRKPRATWRDLPDEEDGVEDEAAEADPEALAAKASQREWEELAREVREEKRKRFAEAEFASGRRDIVVGYDDVADDLEEPEAPRPPRSGGADGAEAEEGAAARSAADNAAGVPSASVAASATVPAAAVAASLEGADGAVRAQLEQEGETRLPPQGAVTAGQAGKKKNRGGKKPGSHKRKRDEEGEGEEKKKEDEEAESKRWLKLKLEGEQKPKRVKAARIVSYYDFDAGYKGEVDVPAASGTSAFSSATASATAEAAAPAAALPPTLPAAPAPASGGNFRSQLRRDLFDDEDDGEE